LHAAYQIDEFVKAPNIAMTRSLCRSRADVDWRLLTFRDDGGIAYDMDDDVLAKALSLYRPMRLAEGNTDVVETTVFGVDTVRSFQPLYEEYEDTLTHADHVARNSTTFWYMGGNFVEWIDSKLFDGDVMSYTLSIGVDEATAQSHFEQLPDTQEWILKPESRNDPKMPPRLFVLRNSLLTGYFVRLMPGYESYKIGWKVRDPEHRRFPDDERHYLRSVSTKLISALFLTWPRI
jgi:hypothetical protein